jgi:DNA-binding CsgD family transcriptional regulator
MSTAFWFIITVLSILLIPAVVIGWLVETPTERIQRRRRAGWTQRAIAERQGITLYRVRKALAAA